MWKEYMIRLRFLSKMLFLRVRVCKSERSLPEENPCWVIQILPRREMCMEDSGDKKPGTLTNLRRSSFLCSYQGTDSYSRQQC